MNNAKFLKGNVRNFSETVNLLLVFGQRTLFSIIKLVFREKREFYLFCYNVVSKDHVVFKKTQPSIEIDIIVVKKYVFLVYVFF